MTENDRSLPEPTRQRFGRDAQGEPAPLLSDKMAMAAAAGRLDEFLQQELPAGDHARKLAMMMMGMSGMMPATSAEPGPGAPPAPEIPPAALAAAIQGDVEGLKSLLQAEHARRSGAGSADSASQEAAELSPASPAAARPAAGIDQAIVEELLRIAADNDVSLDWLMLRAVKLYVAEYRKTGRL